MKGYSKNAVLTRVAVEGFGKLTSAVVGLSEDREICLVNDDGMLGTTLGVLLIGTDDVINHLAAMTWTYGESFDAKDWRERLYHTDTKCHDQLDYIGYGCWVYRYM